MQPLCKTTDAENGILRDQIPTTVTQTPSSYEGEGEGLNLTREMIGIFKW